jgi:meso-butanediol dehydrogenase/(S,S)-butanediol dehydrogenase/diacetyl reductase
MAGRLDGKIALISGTGGGQGRVAAEMFVAEGAKVVGCDVKAEAEAETAKLIKDAGGDYVSVAPCDLSTRAGAEEWVAAGVEAFGGIDILYNNASVPKFGPVGAMPDEDWDFTLRNELDLVWHCCGAAWPHLVERDGASIVNVASVAALVGDRGMPEGAHAATKGAVIALTRQLAAEGAAVGIRANCISPGVVRGPVTEEMLGLGDQNPLKALLDTTAWGRAAEPEEIVHAALFLASDEASYVTGVNLPVDAGTSVFV